MKEQKTADVIAALTAQGWVKIRNPKGSHEIWGSAGKSATVSIPTGHRKVSVGILRQLKNKGLIIPNEWN